MEPVRDTFGTLMETPVALNVDDNDEQGGGDIFLGANR